MEDNPPELQKPDKVIDTLPSKENVTKVKEAIREIRESVKGESEIPEEIQILLFDTFLALESPFATKSTREKKVWFSFDPTKAEKKEWIKNGFPKFTRLLSFLNKTYGGLENFDLVFFRANVKESFYVKQVTGKIMVYVSIDKYQKLGKDVNSVIRDFKITKYANGLRNEFSEKVPISFFNRIPSAILIEELVKSYYGTIEAVIKDYEEMPEGEQKKNIRTILVHSKLANDAISEFNKLTPESPEKQLKLFLKVYDKLPHQEFEILVNHMLESKSATRFIKYISKLPKRQQNQIAIKLPEMTTLYNRYEKLKSSLKRFEELIEEHSKSKIKNEKKIHQYLIKHYWLLGIEYFGKQLLSDIDTDGKRTSETRLDNSKKRPDFIINRLDGFDKCVVIEIEEANDSIFTTNGEFPKEVYDGIFQAADYNIEQKFRGVHSKGIAIIGSIKGVKLTQEHKKRFKLLREEFPNIEILTYDDIIDKAKTTLEFWKRYDVKKILEDNE